MTDDSGKKRLLGIINKVPLFQDLTLYQAEKILLLCRPRKYEVDETLCEQGTQSNEMFILLSGELGVLRDDSLIASIKPVVPVGEMGILTGDPRTATVVAKEESSLLVIRRAELESMMRNDIDIAMVILKSFSQALTARLANTNESLEKHRHEIQELKRQIVEYRRRVEVSEQQLVEFARQIEMYKQRIKELEQGVAAAEPVDDREAVRRLVEQHLAMVKAKDYRSSYEHLSIEARYDVPWADYERIKKGIEELGEIQRLTLETFEMQKEEDLEYYYIKYAVSFTGAAGILELYVQQENGEWKISHDIVTVGGEAHTV
jgi:CRP-like cAMP-binding protein